MEDKIRICFQSTFAYPLFNPESNVTHGGSEVQMYLLAKELAKDKKYDVTVLVGDFGQKNKEKYGDISVVKAHNLERRFVNYLKGPFRLYHKLKTIHPDVVIQRGAAAETGICAFYCNANRKKFIYSIAHEMDVNGEFVTKGIRGKMYSYGINRADSIVAQNQEQIDLIKKKLPKLVRRTKVIKSGYEIRRSTNFKKDTILWVGRSDKWKLPNLFLRLAEEFPKERFVMIMPKSSDFDNWKKYSEKAKNMNNVDFIEKVRFSKIQQFFDRAKLFINTSEYEGFPNTFIQSCMAGTPIVSLSVNPDNFIDKEGCGYVCNSDYKKMKNNINKILYKENYKLFSKSTIRFVRKNHDIKEKIKEWKEIINEKRDR